MKHKNKLNLILFLSCFLAGFFVFSSTSSATENSVIISAVQIEGVQKKDDFIELYNSTCSDISLASWKIKKRSSTGSESSLGTLKNSIPAKGYYLWENTSQTLDDNPDYSTHGYTLSDDYSIGLFNNSSEQIDSLTWGDNPNPFSPTIVTLNPDPSYAIRRDESDNIVFVNNYSPKNSTIINTSELLNCPIIEPVSYSTNIQITEIYPRPSNADNQDEFVELFNFGDSTENLDGWKLEDRAGKICDLSGEEIEAKSFLVITENSSDQCNLALNNTQGETLNLFNPQDSDPVFSVSYTDSAKKGLSYSLDGSSWRWSKFLTPGAENIFNNLPTAKTDVPEKVYRNTFADFSAKGSDKDKDELKYTWDFGDGHKSYKQITRHKYEKTGKYSVTLKISDGSEDKIKTFKLEVENFPKLDVNIIELSPNPAGVDTDVEYILLKNASKKKINLKGWSIATGEKKKMINHPITLDLILKPKKEFKLTHLYSKFSLNNTSARIELRYPNGKVASHVTYKSPKKSLPEDSLYEKIKGGWAWKFPAIKPKDSPIVATTEASMIAAITQPPEKTTQQLQQEMETQNNLGNFSPEPTIETKKQEKFSLLNFGLHIQTASAFSDETLQPQKDFFATPQTPTHKHWATQLRDDLFFKINSWLNGVL